MTICICAGPDGGVPRSRQQIRIAVIAIREVCAMIEKEAKPLRLEIATIALKVIFAELIDDKNDDELRMRVISAGICAAQGSGSESDDNKKRAKALQHRHSLSQNVW